MRALILGGRPAIIRLVVIAVVLAAVTVAVGLAVEIDWLTFVVAFVSWLAVAFLTLVVTNRPILFLIPALAAALLFGAIYEYCGNRILERGELTPVVVTGIDREREPPVVYHLRHEDGRPIDEPMTYAGSGGWDQLQVGSHVNVWFDPAGRQDPKPEFSVDSAGARGAAIGGLVAFVVLAALFGTVWRGPERVPNDLEEWMARRRAEHPGSLPDD